MEGSKYKRLTISFTEADAEIVKYLDELKASGGASNFVREAIKEKINGVSTSKKGITEEMVRVMIEEALSTSTPPPPMREHATIDLSKAVDKVIDVEEDVDDAILDAIDSFEF